MASIRVLVSRVMELLFRRRRDRVTAVVAAAGVAASYFPARRATRVDPIVTLRHE